jgi:medium-chain acyl-[acyl-carrier-protein] hydrolase
MLTMARTRGFTFFRAEPDVELRLFCFPHAGGNAQNFRELASLMEAEIEVVGVDYPGRGQRFGEPPLHHLPDLVHNLVAGIRPLLDRPFAFYGHSNGALVAFELARHMTRTLYRYPEVLFLGAKRSPQLGPERATHGLPAEDFIEVLRGYGGTPPELFRSTEVLDLFLPVIRADFALSETYVLQSKTPIDVPLHALAGTSDPFASVAEVMAWKEMTRGHFTFHQLDGGHFFLSTHASAVACILRQALGANRQPLSHQR